MATTNRLLVSSSSSHAQQHQLLDASKQGKVEEVRSLLKLGESVTQRDHKGNTPLHLASMYGRLSTVKLLVEKGAPVEVLNLAEETPLDLAKCWDQSGVVSFLLKNPSYSQIKRCISSSNTMLVQKNKTKILPSADTRSKGPLAGITLIQNNNSWSPSQKKARSSSIEMLETSALLKRSSAFQPIPVVAPNGWALGTQVSPLVFRSVPSLLSLLKSSQGSNTVDREGEAYLQFEAAYEAGKTMDQILSLEKLAELYLEKKDYIRADHLINGAIVVATRARVEQSRANLLYQKLMEIEQLFLTEELGLKASKTSRPTYARQKLKKIREEAALRLQQNKPIQEIQGFLTESYKVLLCKLIKECMDLFGKERPKGFAVMGLGSMARGEMCPYSDVEFAFLIRDPTPQNLAYFRRLSQLLTLKMINIGETKHELIRPKRVNQVMQPAKSLTPTGFSMDIGGLCPEGKKGIYELIGSPEQLANFQTPEWLQQNKSELILANAMTTVCCLMGNDDLVTEYQKRISQILNGGVSSSSSSTNSVSTLQRRRALELMKGYVDEFKPRLDESKLYGRDARGFDVKQELYRLPQTVISGLALYHGVKSTPTLVRLDKLCKRGLLTSEGVNQLKKVMELICGLRIEAHLFYGTEKEILYHSKGAIDESAVGLYPITKQIQQEIIEAYKSLIPLHQRAKRFVQGDEAAFANCSFHDMAVGTYDDQQRKNLNFDSALQSAQAKAALDPNNPLAQSGLGLVQSDLGKVYPALLSCQEALASYKQKHGNKPHLDVAMALTNLGNSLEDLGSLSKAIEHHDNSLEMKRQIYGANKAHLSIAKSLNNLGNAYDSWAKYPEAIKYYKASLQMMRTLYKKHEASLTDVASSLANLGSAYCNSEEYSKAIQYLEESLEMNRTIYKDKAHPNIAISLTNLGSAYGALNNQSFKAKAIKCLEASLKMKRTIYEDKAHPSVAKSLNHLGNTYSSWTKYSEAIKYYKASLKMNRAIYGKEKAHPDVAGNLNNLGKTYDSLGNYSEASNYYEESLKIARTLNAENKAIPDITIAGWLMNLGNVYYELEDVTKEVECYQLSYDLSMQALGAEHPNTKQVKAYLTEALENQKTKLD